MSIPTAEPISRHMAEASRSLLGRSSKPTSAPKVNSAGPPVARLLLTASATAAAFGKRLVASSVTTSTQPSMRAKRVSIDARAAFWSSVRFAIKAPDSRAIRSSSGCSGSNSSAS